MAGAVYTTGDEEKYLLDLARRGKWEALEQEYRSLDKRNWSGDGMAVDVERVRATLGKLLAQRPAAAGASGCPEMEVA